MRDLPQIIDINVSLGHWPFQPLAPASPSALVRHLKKLGISKAVVSSIDAVFYRDPQWGNARLFDALKGFEPLIPSCVIHPGLNHWEECLDACLKAGARMAKLFPNYHLYGLDNAVVDRLVQGCAERKVAVAISLRIEDERAHPALMSVPETPIEAMISLARRHPRVPFLALCPTLWEARRLVADTKNIRVELSHIEHLDSLKTLLSLVPASRVLFGSHLPFLHAEAALSKLLYATASSRDLDRICHGNAETLLCLSG